ncbi:helix-turn-helix transcriptional regulator [Jejuia pallidilutea]|uniref:helix-turn-helix transcriptional regulator n=1 Tax=Jejuia pallidilutea TaxID=504487 RepID=UPI00187CA89B|nr:hypothetical protein [Jejuia pallidilutea]
MAAPKNNFSLKIVRVLLFLSLVSSSCYGQGEGGYYRFLDSANVTVDINSQKTLQFLDSIPKPLEENIKGRIAEYYSVKALIHDEHNEYTKFQQSNILALKYAVEEDNYCIAGQASLDLHTDKYLIAADTADTKYLDKAKMYLEKCEEDKYAVLQIETMQSYYKSLDGKFKESNAILLNRLNYYRSIKDEVGYYYMFANYMLASNYLQLKNLQEAHKYLKRLKKLKNNKTILLYNYKSFMASIDLFFAEIYFEKTQIDSTFYYLTNASKNTKYMVGDALQDYYELSASAYKHSNNIEMSKAYIDSLVMYGNNLFVDNLGASFDVNNDLLNAESELIEQKNQKASILKIVFWLLGFIVLVSLIYYFFYVKQRVHLKKVEDKTKGLSYLKSNNEQLTVKVHGLEAYIKNLKKEVKDIATTKCLEEQKSRIKELYTNLHINSSTILDKSESHLELVNELNIDFFRKIDETYPQLNKSEVIICYYILIGFNNKEISVFLNTSIRSVESKRYRISKKINFDKERTTLVEHLHKTFKDTLHSTIHDN